MPGKRAFGLALIDLIGAAVQATRRHRHDLDNIPRALLRDLNLPCCGPIPRT